MCLMVFVVEDLATQTGGSTVNNIFSSGRSSMESLVVLSVSMSSGIFVVEYLATQTGGTTVNNIFEVRFTYTKISQARIWMAPFFIFI